MMESQPLNPPFSITSVMKGGVEASQVKKSSSLVEGALKIKSTFTIESQPFTSIPSNTSIPVGLSSS